MKIKKNTIPQMKSSRNSFSRETRKIICENLSQRKLIRVKRRKEECKYRCVHTKSLHSCPILCNPMDCGLPGSLVHVIFQQEYWSRLLFPPPGALPEPGIEPAFLTTPALAGGFFTTSAIWKAPEDCKRLKLLLLTKQV